MSNKALRPCLAIDKCICVYSVLSPWMVTCSLGRYKVVCDLCFALGFSLAGRAAEKESLFSSLWLLFVLPPSRI